MPRFRKNAMYLPPLVPTHLLKGIEMDATQMTFADGTFEVAIDKGTLDAVLVCFSWYTSNPARQNKQVFGKSRNGLLLSLTKCCQKHHGKYLFSVILLIRKGVNANRNFHLHNIWATSFS
jgi:hypothetical protein